MSTTTYWSPNQAAIAQVETYTFSAPIGVGNTYSATINGKTVTYTSVSGDTAATVATALLALLSVSTSIAAEMNEITFANPSSGVLTATARVPGTPFAGVTVAGVTGQGLVLSTGNGLANGIATVHTQVNQSPSDAADPLNWLRVNLSTTPPSRVRALPQSTDDVVLSATTVPILWNADALAAVAFNTLNRYQSMTGQIGLPDVNAAGYVEWRATRFKFLGPQGSVPAGGLALIVGNPNDGLSGSGPSLERYDLQSSQYTLTALDGNDIDIIGQHTANSFTTLGSVNLLVAANNSTKSVLSSSSVGPSSTVTIGANVVWTAGSTLTVNGGTVVINSAPATVSVANGGQITVTTDQLTWATFTLQGGSTATFLAGGTITTLTMTTSCTLNKSQDARPLTITNSTIDGDTCVINDPLNAITWTNATTVKQQVLSGPFLFTGSRTVKVT
jgi:hypothetical protein